MNHHQNISNNEGLVVLKELRKDLKALKALHSQLGKTISTDSLTNLGECYIKE